MIGAIPLSWWDWAFIVWFLAVITRVGLWYSKRAGSSLNEYFLSGRDLPWWALGTSMVATTFAADTPVAVAEFVVDGGIAKNWLWWSFVFGGALTVFVFARWWRRSEVFTEVELVALRYDGKAASVLRGFKAVYLGLLCNAIVIGWVTSAMVGIVETIFDVEPAWAIAGLLGLALLYSALAGLWGVVATDVLQFAMALVGAVLLAVLAVDEAGGLAAMVAKVEALEQQHGRDILSIVPTGWDAFTASVLVLMLVNWWAVYYPGAEPGGGGYVAQRMFAAKDERHARAGTLWFMVAHYVLRPWPWILVALSAIALQPELLTGEMAAKQAYPSMFRVLPAGALGLVVASFFAAYISTITTQLNLASSYLVNDCYLPFLAKGDGTERGRVRVARLAVVLVLAVGVVVTLNLESVGAGWGLLMELTGGTGLVLILRWLWWRVSAWSEIAAMIASALVCLWSHTDAGHAVFVGWAGGADSPMVDRYRLLCIIAVTTVVWLGVTFATRPVAAAHLEAFFRRVRPGGWWGPVSAATGVAPSPLGRDLAMWGLSSVAVFGALFGIGSALLLDGGIAIGCLVAAAVASFALVRMLRAEAAA